MKSKHRFLVVLFFLLPLCEPAFSAMITGYFSHREEIGAEDTYHPENTPVLFVTATAYSSTEDQTDSSPFTMASGKRVYDGAIAANFLPMGTKVMLPETHGRKVFTVEDRTHRRFSDRIDIWMETREEALQFGIKRIAIQIL